MNNKILKTIKHIILFIVMLFPMVIIPFYFIYSNKEDLVIIILANISTIISAYLNIKFKEWIDKND